MLDEIHRQRDLARQARSAAEIAQKEAEAIRKELADRLDQIEDERIALLEKARLEAEDQLSMVRDELETLRRQLARAHQPLDVVNEVAEVVETLKKSWQNRSSARHPKPVRKTKGPLHLGEKVHLRSIDQDGVVTGITEADIEVQVGMLRIRPPFISSAKARPKKIRLNSKRQDKTWETILPGRISPGLNWICAISGWMKGWTPFKAI